jgi:Flp pilus assembly protein TadD
MSKHKQQCPCGSGKATRRCCGMPSSAGKLKLERLARIMSETGMHAEAAQALGERAKFSPENPMIWNDLGIQHMAAGQSDEAYAAFVRAHRALPEYPLPLYNLGRLAMGRCIQEQAKQRSSIDLLIESATEAIGHLKESLERDPLLTHAHVLLSIAYETIGDVVHASLHMQEAVRLDPDISPRQRTPFLRRLISTKVRPSSPFIASDGKHTSLNAN